MRGYSKLDCGIIHSTVWQEAHDVRVTWITLLAMCDATGCVRAAIPAIAKVVDVKTPRMVEIIELFCSPDPYSRTKDNDGRRLEEIDGGWQILNYGKYREGLKQPDTTASQRKQRERDRKKQEECHTFTVTKRDSHGASRSVTAGHAYAEAEADAEAVNSSTTYSCAESFHASTQQQQNFVMNFPCKGVKTKTFALTQKKLDEWLETYGASLNVPHELRLARQWLLDNPSRQKTSGRVTTFLGSWLADAQNRRGGKDATTSPATPQMQAEPVRDSQIKHRGFTAAYSVESGKVDHFLVSDGSQSWRIPSGLPVKEALIAIREQIDGKIDGAR